MKYRQFHTARGTGFARCKVVSYYQSGEERKLQEKWWDFRSSHPYPVYCTMLATTADTEAVRVLMDHGTELDAVTGQDCGFVYFRDLDKLKAGKLALTPFSYDEHSAMVYPLAELLSLDPDELPCLLFFETLARGKFVTIGLADKSTKDIIQELRRALAVIRRHRGVDVVKAMRKYERAKQWEAAKEDMAKKGPAIFEMLTKLGFELLMGSPGKP